MGPLQKTGKNLSLEEETLEHFLQMCISSECHPFESCTVARSVDLITQRHFTDDRIWY
jgi:hypothetical protein